MDIEITLKISDTTAVTITEGHVVTAQTLKEIEASLLQMKKEGIAEFKQILEDNRGETLFGDEDSNEVMKTSIDAFIEAVKRDLSLNEQPEEKECWRCKDFKTTGMASITHEGRCLFCGRAIIDVKNV